MEIFNTLNTSLPKIMIICFTVPVIWQLTDIIVIFHFWLFFAVLLPPPPPQQHNTKKQNFLKNEKNAWRYHHFTHVPKIMITWCNFQDCLNPICSSGQEIKTTFPSSLSQLLLCKKNIFLKKITSLILIFYSRATYL